MFYASTTQANLTSALAGILLMAASPVAQAQAYPSRPITLISPVTPGGAIEVATRSWMACAQEIGGKPIVLVARPGANGVVAANAAKLAPADGYTFMVAGMSQTTITPFIYKKQPYDPEKDFHGVALFGDTPLVLVTNTQSGIKNLKDLQAYASSRPKGMDIGHAGMAHTSHLLGAATVDMLGVNGTLVPYAGEAAAAAALMAGDIQAMVMVSGTAAPFIESGKIVPRLTFSNQRLPRLPDVPTVVEKLSDPSMARSGWIGITAKAGTPQEAINAVESWTKTCMDNAGFRQALERALFTPYFVTQKEFGEVVRRDSEFWKTWIARLGISND